MLVAQTLIRTGNRASASAGAYLIIDIPYGWHNVRAYCSLSNLLGSPTNNMRAWT